MRMNAAGVIKKETIHDMPQGKIGMWLFLLMDGLSFATILIAGAYYRANGTPWAAPGSILDVPLTFINTMLLLVSSLTMMLALQAVRQNDQRGLKKYLLVTLVLGISFLCIQAYEYTHFIIGSEHLASRLAAAGFSGSQMLPSSSIYAGVFYGATGFHGLHVLAGLIFMVYIISGALKNKYNAKHHGRLEVLTLYWHFVDLMWMLVFTGIYLM
jgi:heme/copper-type cytochrome/quinol oxidase subunit 3